MQDSYSNLDADECVYCEMCKSAFWTKYSLRRHIAKLKHFIHNVIPPPVFLKVALPPDEQFSILNLQKHDAKAFTVKIILPNVKNAETYHEWLQRFMKINNCIYVCVSISKGRCRKLRKSSSLAVNLLQVLHKCQHFNSRIGKKRKRKGTSCKSKIYSIVKKSGMFCYTHVTIHFNHNHSNESAEALHYRKPDAEIKKLFKLMFDEGILSPTVALSSYKNHLRIQLDETQYLLQSADRSIVPDYDWVRHLFYLFSQDSYGCYGNSKSTGFVQSLKKVIKNRNSTLNNVCALKELPNNDIVIAILSPLMRKALQAKTSADILFMDTLGSVKFFEVKIFFIITQSEVPGGIIIVSNESAKVMQEGYDLFFTLLDDSCFGGRKKGSSVLMTEDFCKKLPALAGIFTESRILLSTFHFLQSIFKFLICSENSISERDCLLIYANIRKAVFAANEENSEAYFKEACDVIVDERLQMYLQRVFSKRKKWAFCYLPESISRDSVSGFMGRSTRRFRDHLLNTLKSRSAEALVNFLTEGYEEYFRHHLIEHCEKTDHSYVDEYALNDNEADTYELIEYEECETINAIVNRRKNMKYLINTDVGICTCYKGVEGKYCKHQSMLQKVKRIKQSSIALEEAEIKSVIDYDMVSDATLNSFSSIDDEINVNLDETECVTPTWEDHNGEDNSLTSDTDIIVEPADNLIAVNENILAEINEETKKIKENFTNWIDNLKERPDFFINGIRSMNEELLNVISCSPTTQLSALLNFNKNIDGLN